jgi:hypothetical protein
MTYSALAGRGETPLLGFLWASANVLPWFVAFEAAKRIWRIPAQAGLLALALAVPVVVYSAFPLTSGRLPFEFVRKLPALVLVCGLLVLGRWARRRAAGEAAMTAGELPFLPHELDWVSAAGNYVELHGSFGVRTHRALLGSLEAQLKRHGFVRIHRSTLVRRDKIARIRNSDIVLQDGTSLKTGMRYRAEILQDR